MAKYFSLEIPEPCHENWNQMSPREHGRYCSSCEKTVIDFSNMTDGQLAAFFKKNPENICGRFYPDQLDRSIAVPKKPWPLAKYFLTVTIPAFLLSLKSSGQIKPGEIRTVPVERIMGQRVISAHTITGTVLDEKGIPVPGATVQITGTKSGVATDMNGSFTLKIPAGKDSLRVSGVGFISAEVNIQGKDSVTITLKWSKDNLETVIINTIDDSRMVKGAAYSTVTRRYYSRQVKPAPAKINSINIYPNPVRTNTALTITWAEKIKGNQFIEIFSAEGKLIQAELQSLVEKNNTASLQLHSLARGHYILRTTNLVTKEKFSKEFIVL